MGSGGERVGSYMEEHKFAIMLLVFGLVFFYPYYSNAQIPRDTDAKSHFVHVWYYQYSIDTYREIPQWSWLWYFGFPISLNLIPPYIIVALLSVAIPLGTAFWYKFVFALSAVFSSVIIYAICREYGISEKASFVGALLFMLNPRLLFTIGEWGQYTTVFAIVPLLLMIYFMKRGRIDLAAISFALVILSSLETALILAYVLSAFAIAKMLERRYSEAFKIPAEIAVLGFLLASFWFIPSMQHVLGGGQENVEGVKVPISPLNVFTFLNSEEWPGLGIATAALGVLGTFLALKKGKVMEIAVFSVILLVFATTIGYHLLDNPLSEPLRNVLYRHPVEERQSLFLVIPLSVLSAFVLDLAQNDRLRLRLCGTAISGDSIFGIALLFVLVPSLFYASQIYPSLTDTWAPDASQREVIDFFNGTGNDARVFVGEGVNAAGDFDRYFPIYTHMPVVQGFMPHFALNLPYLKAMYSQNFVALSYQGGVGYYVLNKDREKTIVPYYEWFRDIDRNNPGKFSLVLENKEYAVYKDNSPAPFVTANVPVSFSRASPERIDLALENCTGSFNVTVRETYSNEWVSDKGNVGRTPLYFINLEGRCDGKSEKISLEFRHDYYFRTSLIGALLFIAYFYFIRSRLYIKTGTI